MKKPFKNMGKGKPLPAAGSKPFESALIGGVGNAKTVKSSKKGK
jgi:hypothetical protein